MSKSTLSFFCKMNLCLIIGNKILIYIAGHHCRFMAAKQMGGYLWWLCTLWERACSVLLPKIVTSSSPARDEVPNQTGGLTGWFVSPPFPSNFVHLSEGCGFDSRDRKLSASLCKFWIGRDRVTQTFLSYTNLLASSGPWPCWITGIKIRMPCNSHYLNQAIRKKTSKWIHFLTSSGLSE